MQRFYARIKQNRPDSRRKRPPQNELSIPEHRLKKPVPDIAGLFVECIASQSNALGISPLSSRFTKRQGELFADGSEAKYFAVGNNQWDWRAARLLEWQREKAGTIEALHDVLKNDLAAGVMPCGRFGANAAWLRLAVMTHNVLTALKRLAMPEKHPLRLWRHSTGQAEGGSTMP